MKNGFLSGMIALLFLSTAFAQDAEPVATPAPAKEWKSNVGFSALLNTGNSDNQTFGGNGLLSYKVDKNKIETTAIGAYGRARDNTTGVTSTNTENWKATGRYDRYILDPLSLFTLGQIGQDRPAGFDSRYGVAAGASHEAWKTAPDFFKYEAGFDWTHENRVAAVDEDIYSGRLFLQYKRKISNWSNFGQDVESLFNVQHGNDVRLNTLTSISAKLTDKAALQVGYAVRFDNVPVPGFKKTDTTTQIGLVVTLL